MERWGLGLLIQTDKRDIPCHTSPCSTIRLGEGSFVLSSHYLETRWASICWWEVVNDCLCNTCFFLGFCLFCFFFSLLTKLSLSWPIITSHPHPPTHIFSLLILSPSHGEAEVSVWLGGSLALAEIKPPHHRNRSSSADLFFFLLSRWVLGEKLHCIHSFILAWKVCYSYAYSSSWWDSSSVRS